MDNYLSQLGIGGILVLLILREILPYLKSKNGTNNRLLGTQTVDFWENNAHTILRGELKVLVDAIYNLSASHLKITEQLTELLILARQKSNL